jgi:hypothetical protein
MSDEKISPMAVRAIVIILVVMALLAVYTNVQKLRRDKVETVTVTPVATPAASPVQP